MTETSRDHETPKIYVTPEAIRTLEAIKGMDYYERTGEPGLRSREGYFLNTASCEFRELPADATVHSSPAPSEAGYREVVSLPAELQGVVFSNAPRLPPGYAENLAYWGRGPRQPSSAAAVYFQNKDNEYMVPLTEDPAKGDAIADPQRDRMLTEGIVARVSGLGSRIREQKIDPSSFIRVSLPNPSPAVPAEGSDEVIPGDAGELDISRAPSYQDIYLLAADVLGSPDPDSIYIDVLRFELLDYGYFY